MKGLKGHAPAARLTRSAHFTDLSCATRAAMEKMSRVTTALGGSVLTGRTMHCHLDAPANAISVCRGRRSGRGRHSNIFKIYAIEEEQFVEKLNLRVGHKPSLNLSCADVVWHQMDGNLLATAATNGRGGHLEPGRPSRNKQDQLFTEHKRTVNKVCAATPLRPTCCSVAPRMAS